MLKYSYFHRTVKAWNCLSICMSESLSLSDFKRLNLICKAYFHQLDAELTSPQLYICVQFVEKMIKVKDIERMAGLYVITS